MKILVAEDDLDNARLLLKISVFYLPALFGMIILDKIV